MHSLSKNMLKKVCGANIERTENGGSDEGYFVVEVLKKDGSVQRIPVTQITHSKYIAIGMDKDTYLIWDGPNIIGVSYLEHGERNQICLDKLSNEEQIDLLREHWQKKHVCS